MSDPHSSPPDADFEVSSPTSDADVSTAVAAAALRADRATAGLAERIGLGAGSPHLVQALTHSSYANERRDAADNQRLEFLGDAVLGFCVSEFLYRRFPDADEGTLTRLRARLVNAETLAEVARSLGVAEALRLGRGAIVSGLGTSTNVLADAVEALIAACFLDAGLETARSLCERVVESRLDALEKLGGPDPKSELQELFQARGSPPPLYELVEATGPAHARWFRVRVRGLAGVLCEGMGRSKRDAERDAAEAALAAARDAEGGAP